jgi:undecaprenyl-diphosphatase
LLVRRGFWLMLLAVVICALPVIWWNQHHHWASAVQLGDRGHVHDRFRISFSTFRDFLGSQALVISPLLFAALLVTAGRAKWSAGKAKRGSANEGELLLLLLFLSVFLFYAVVSLHIRCEPNWPAVSYLSLIIVLAGRWREILASRPLRLFTASAFCLAWLEMVVLHDTRLLPLSPHGDPMSRTAGWSPIAGRMELERERTQPDILLADGYKEASVIAFYLPDRHFVYALPHAPPANQFDLWPTFPADAHQRILWITDDKSPEAERYLFGKVTFLERVQIWFRGAPLRAYRIYLCQDPLPATRGSRR